MGGWVSGRLDGEKELESSRARELESSRARAREFESDDRFNPTNRPHHPSRGALASRRVTRSARVERWGVKKGGKQGGLAEKHNLEAPEDRDGYLIVDNTFSKFATNGIGGRVRGCSADPRLQHEGCVADDA